MPARLTVAFDLDGTLYDWDGRLNQILLRLDPSFPVVASAQRTHYDHLHDEAAASGFGRDPRRDVATLAEALAHPELYQRMSLRRGAVKAVRHTLEEGHHVIFVSTPDVANLACAVNKYQQIGDDFAALFGSRAQAAARLILTHDKTLVDADVLFDDKPIITGHRTPAWAQVLAGQPYNRDSALVRVDELEQWPKMIEAIADHGTDILRPRSHPEQLEVIRAHLARRAGAAPDAVLQVEAARVRRFGMLGGSVRIGQSLCGFGQLPDHVEQVLTRAIEHLDTQGFSQYVMDADEMEETMHFTIAPGGIVQIAVDAPEPGCTVGG